MATTPARRVRRPHSATDLPRAGTMQVLPPEPRYLHGRHSQHATLSPALTLPPASFVCVIMCGMPWFSLASTASRKKLLGVLPDAPSPKRALNYNRQRWVCGTKGCVQLGLMRAREFKVRRDMICVYQRRAGGRACAPPPPPRTGSW